MRIYYFYDLQPSIRSFVMQKTKLSAIFHRVSTLYPECSRSWRKEMTRYINLKQGPRADETFGEPTLDLRHGRQNLYAYQQALEAARHRLDEKSFWRIVTAWNNCGRGGKNGVSPESIVLDNTRFSANVARMARAAGTIVIIKP